MNKKSVLGMAVLGLLSGSQALASGDASNSERCYGVAKKGQNDCGNKHHMCGGQSKIDGQTDEWIYVPKGLCKKLAKGSLKSKAHKLKANKLKKKI